MFLFTMFYNFCFELRLGFFAFCLTQIALKFIFYGPPLMGMSGSAFDIGNIVSGASCHSRDYDSELEYL